MPRSIARPVAPMSTAGQPREHVVPAPVDRAHADAGAGPAGEAGARGTGGRSAPRSRFFVVTGLPASGKTTVGAAIADALRLPLIDKDMILESLFDTMGIGDAAWRTTLSRASDLVLQRTAQASGGAVLVSWWRHPASQAASGTPTSWLHALPGELTEVHCRCRPEVAIERFFARRRHPGHLDGERSRDRELEALVALAALGPIGGGRLVEVCTDDAVRLPQLAARLGAAAPAGASARPAE